MSDSPEARKPRRLDDAFDQMRAESPELDRRIRENTPRRRLGLAMTRLRVEADLTQREMAGALSTTETEVSRIESNTDIWPTPAELEAYVGACADRAGFSADAAAAELADLLEMLPKP